MSGERLDVVPELAEAVRTGRARIVSRRPYEVNGRRIDHLPASTAEQAAAKPVYERFEGWNDSTQGARSWADLPAAAIKYIRRIEELIDCPVALVSTSPERDDTILVRDPFRD